MRLRAFVLLTFVTAAAAYAQKPAPMELGFHADKVYEFGSIDSVNAFNGNLILTLPIGMRYPVATGFDYGLTLTYNGKIWDYYTVQPYDNGNFYQEARPNLRSNAGVGWRLSLGRLLAPSNPTLYGYTDGPLLWTYESPSGDEHTFLNTVYDGTSYPCGDGAGLNLNANVQFSCDGSHLRMQTINSTTRDVEFPDGRIHEFTFQHNAWLLSLMKDRVGNVVTVTYPGADSDPVTECDMADAYNRRQVIHYRNLPEMNDSIDHGQNIDYIEITASGAASTVRYTFNYSTVDVPKGPYDDFTGTSLPGAPPCSNLSTDLSQCTIAMPLLTSIDLPDSQSPTRNHFNLAYYIDESSKSSYSQGLLGDLQLPTGGHHHYTYQTYTLPPAGKCDPKGVQNDTPGIQTRVVDGHIWTYSVAVSQPVQLAEFSGSLATSTCKDPEGSHFPENGPSRWSRTSIISPLDDATGKASRVDSYFSVYGSSPSGLWDGRLHADNSSGCNCTMSGYSIGYPGVAGWPGTAKAKLLQPSSTDCASGYDCDAKIDDGSNSSALLSMTSQTYDGCTAAGDCSAGTLLRTTWTRNAGSKGDVLPTVSERTTYEDDKNFCSGGPCYQQTDKSESDNAGHFKTTRLSSNYPGSPGDSRHTGYFDLSDSQAQTRSIPWLLETYSEKYRTLGGITDRTQYCFDNAGQITRTRKMASNDGSAGTHDLVTVFTYSGADVTDMKSYGGDYPNQSLSTSDLCSMTLPSQPEYWNHYGYSYGVLASDRVYTPSGTPMSFLSLDRTIEQKTGLVTASRSTDGLGTSYEYEAWGSLKKVTPPGESPTTFAYTPYDPSTGSNATVVAATPDPSPATTSNTVTYSYDGQGRLFKTSRAFPGASCAEQVIGYDNNLRRATESVWKPCGLGGGNTTTRYDGLGRILNVTTPDNKVSSVAYVGARHVDRTVTVAQKNGEQNVIQGEDYDVFGRLVNVSNPLMTGSYQYDIGDRLTRVDVSAPGTTAVQTRLFSYDNRGLLLSETHPELGNSGGGTTAYQHFNGSVVDQGYDSRGHSHYKNTGSAFTLFTTFDPAERVLTVTDGSSPSHVLKQFSYDSTDPVQCPSPSCNGKLSSSTRLNPALGSLQTTEYYRYDGNTGRPARRDTSVSGTSGFARFTGLSFSFAQQYNAIGALKTVTYPCRIGAPNGSCMDTPLTVGYNYTNGVLSSIDDGSGFPATIWASGITYQPNGLVADVIHGNNKMHEKWTADSTGMARPGVIAARNGADTTDLWSTGTYQFDGAGNIKAIGSTSYVYDDLQQLRTTLNTAGSSFNATTTNFDPFGNILSTTQSYCGSGIRCGSSTSLTRNVDGAHNHYTDMTYDSAGNVITDGHRTLTYDALGMTSSILVSGRYFFYLYDAGDERVAIVEVKGTGFPRTTYTLRGFGNQVLRSYVDDYTTGTENLYRKEDEIWRGDKLLASDNGSVRHYALDHLGSPRLLVDANGNPLGAGTQTFSPWGVGGTTNGGMLQFTGQERDAVNVADGSGNTVLADLPDDFHARLYDPYEGHFLSIDPVEGKARQLQTWNRYAYALNNPINRTDPDGRCSTMAILLGGSIGCGVEAIAKDLSGSAHNVKEAVQGMGPSASYGENVMGAAVVGIALADIGSTFVEPGKTLPAIAESTVERVVETAGRAASPQIKAGARALEKKLGHAAAGGFESAFKEIKPTQANAEKLIKDILANPAVVDAKSKYIDVFNKVGQGLRYNRTTNEFVTFLEGALRP